MPRANSRVALVTGANEGIRFEIARELGRAGHTVILGTRNPEFGRKAAAKLSDEQIDARFVELDVDPESRAQAAAARIGEDFDHLDILVNNAGIADLTGDGLPGVVKLETVERTFRTNFFGALIVTQAMLPVR
jgi:NAD(P)-dependent dehydrogenase (short-subunit alcohol dehydrogenase family)